MNESSNSAVDDVVIHYNNPERNSTQTYFHLPNSTMPTNLINLTNYDHIEFERHVKIIIPTIFGLICLIGFFGNVLVITVVLFEKQMRSTTNILILNLAIADLLFIIFCVPFTAVQYALTSWPFGDIGCKIQAYAMYVCAYASVYTLVLMSVDRYLAVVHAIRSMTLRTEKNTLIAITIVWVVVLLGNTPLLLQIGEHHYDHFGENRSVCWNLADLEDDGQSGKVFQTGFLIFGFIIPLAVTIILYALMLKRLLYGVAPGGRNQSAESIRAKKRVTRMVIIVVVIFAICWLPIQVIMLSEKFGVYPREIPYIAIGMSANCFAYMNSCVNPILYAFLSENFRRSFKKFLCCSDPSRRFECERTNIRFTTTCEKENANNHQCDTNTVYTQL